MKNVTTIHYPLCSLNVVGLRDVEKQCRVISYINVLFNYDIFCMQEIHFVDVQDGLDF